MSDRPALSRRGFVKVAGAAALAPSLAAGAAETAVGRFFRSLTAEQRRQIAFPHDHPLRSVVRANWRVVEPRIADHSKPQQALCREIFATLCSDDGLARFDRQMADDDGGFARYHVAIFGEPGAGPSEWVLTGRHATVRADGASGAASPGPIFLGHSAAGRAEEAAQRKGNVWGFPGARAITLFAALDEAEKAQAAGREGLVVGSLDDPLKRLAQSLLRDLLRPFRDFHPPAILGCLEPDGADRLRLTDFREGVDGPPDVWKLQGPDFAWYYHAAPHVHSWVVMS